MGASDQNLVVLHGTVVSEPTVRELPDGSSVTQLDVRTRLDGRVATAPVVVHDHAANVRVGDVVVVTGLVNRRFFRTGGTTQSRTEVVAKRVIKASRHKAVERALSEVATVICRK